MRIAAVGMAAATVAFVSLAFLLRPGVPTVAVPERVVGDVVWQAPDGEEWQAITGTDTLPIGSRIRTAETGYAGLRLKNESSLRIAPDTVMEFSGDNAIRLTTGTLYVDSGPDRNDATPSMEIVTPAGRAMEIGTQYEVRYTPDDGYRLRVREGRVRLYRSGRIFEAPAGEEIAIDTDGDFRERRIEPSDERWNWIFTVAPVPVVEARPVTTLLEWVARETGRPLHYAAPELRVQAENTTLHGRVGTLTPLEALRVLLATTDLDYVLLDDGTIEVRDRDTT